MDVLLDNIILPKSLFDSLVSADKSVLVLDIGATQTRLALFSPDLQYCPIGLYKTSEVISVEDVIAGYLHNLGIQETAVDTIALGVAGKIDYLAGYVKMTKSNIEVSRSAIQKRFKATTCLMNDAEIAANAAPILEPGVSTKIIHGSALEGDFGNYTTILAACGTGPGLGVWLPGPPDRPHISRAFSTEFGAISLGLQLPDDIVIKIASQKNVPAETLEHASVLSGRGLIQLYNACGGQTLSSPKEVMDTSYQPGPSKLAVELYFNALAVFLRDSTLAFNGERILLAGSILLENTPIVESHKDVLRAGVEGTPAHFWKRGDVPIELVESPYPGILGGLQYVGL
ncbi:MAG: ROK family protein [Acidimicrobiia bacterium]